MNEQKNKASLNWEKEVTIFEWEFTNRFVYIRPDLWKKLKLSSGDIAIIGIQKIGRKVN